MRNLKRALSLALASVMLLGMMVVGTSAASINDFTDADEISNKEAVAIATGLGIFDGYTDGSFGPDKTVTRAEMAVVIAKILHGADVDPSNFAGVSKFTDVPAWAEGYVNLAASLGIIVGVGENQFAPNKTVTTVEASTMLLKALGYYVGETNGLSTDWQLEVTSKATALGLYGDLALGMNAGLTRENVAELVYNTLFAQRVAFDDYRGLYVKANDRNVVVTNGTDDAANTLAQNTFGLYVVEGQVVANGITDAALAGKNGDVGETTVVFEETVDLDKDGKADYADYDFEYDTGLDMIGHNVDVYYRLVKGTPVVFTMVDQATLVAAISYDKDSTTRLAEAANDAGFKKNTILNILPEDYIVNYDMDVVAKDVYNGPAAMDGKTLLVISNTGNYQVDMVIVLDQYLDQVKSINKKGEYSLTLNNVGTTKTVATYEAEKEDYVIVTEIGKGGERYAFEAADVQDATITKLTGITGKRTLITASGVDYKMSPVVYDTDSLENVTDYQDIALIGNTTMILDLAGNLIAIIGEPTVVNYAYVAQFGVQHDNTATNLNTVLGLTAHVYFADGTNKIVYVDDKASDLPDVRDTNDKITDNSATSLNGVIKGDNDSVHYQQVDANGDVVVRNSGALGIYTYEFNSKGKIVLSALTQDEAGVSSKKAFREDDRFIAGHATIVRGSGISAENVVSKINDNVIRMNNDTVYFYINGNYGQSGFSVSVVEDVKNMEAFKVGANQTEETVVQFFTTTNTEKNYNVANVALIDNIVEELPVDIYYYNKGNYEVTENADGKYDLTYYVYDEMGEATTLVYVKSTEEAAIEAADALATGYYTEGASNLAAYAVLNDVEDGWVYEEATSTEAEYAYRQPEDTTKGTMYVVNATLDYEAYLNGNTNFFDNVTGIASLIEENTVIVDACNSGLETIADIIDAFEESDSECDVTVSYSYDLAKLNTGVLYITSYTPASSTGTGTTANANYALDLITVSDDTKTIIPFIITDKDYNEIDLGAAKTATVSFVIEEKGAAGWIETLSGTKSGVEVAANGEGFIVVNYNSAAASDSYRVTLTVTVPGVGTVAEKLAVNPGATSNGNK